MKASTPKPHVVMVGLGYIGLPTAALMAGKGLSVTGVDINPEVIDTINQGKIHIVEPDLEGLVHLAVQKGRLQATLEPTAADVFLIAVPTPFKGNYEPDIAYVESALDNLLPHLQPGNLVILESTSPVGTTQKIQDYIGRKRPELSGHYHLAYCPERVLPGNVIHELEHNDRVIGGIDEASTQAAMRFYAHFVKGELHPTNAPTAEMCKLVENSYRDVNIAFANELSMISDRAGIDVWELIQLANRHPRVNILQPGTGVGGHCIAVDPWFIVSEFPQEAKIIRQAREVNNYKTDWVVERIGKAAAAFEEQAGRPPVVACLGLAFKPDIDDLRESPSLHVTQTLISQGYTILPVEPNLEHHPSLRLYTLAEAYAQADLLVVLVAHREFRGQLPTDKMVLKFVNV